MSKITPAVRFLEQTGIAFSLRTYDYDPNAERVSLQAAEAVGADPACVLKTLMALVDNKPVCAIIPSDHELSMKKLAAAFGGKRAKMMQPSDAERITGYKVGGISPFGQLRTSPTAIEVQALAHEQIYINGGQRGLLVRLDPNEAVRILSAIAAPLAAE